MRLRDGLELVWPDVNANLIVFEVGERNPSCQNTNRMKCVQKRISEFWMGSWRWVFHAYYYALIIGANINRTHRNNNTCHFQGSFYLFSQPFRMGVKHYVNGYFLPRKRLQLVCDFCNLWFSQRGHRLHLLGHPLLLSSHALSKPIDLLCLRCKFGVGFSLRRFMIHYFDLQLRVFRLGLIGFQPRIFRILISDSRSLDCGCGIGFGGLRILLGLCDLYLRLSLVCFQTHILQMANGAAKLYGSNCANEADKGRYDHNYFSCKTPSEFDSLVFRVLFIHHHRCTR
jgi:hypothetical protein